MLFFSKVVQLITSTALLNKIGLRRLCIPSIFSRNIDLLSLWFAHFVICLFSKISDYYLLLFCVISFTSYPFNLSLWNTRVLIVSVTSISRVLSKVRVVAAALETYAKPTEDETAQWRSIKKILSQEFYRYPAFNLAILVSFFIRVTSGPSPLSQPKIFPPLYTPISISLVGMYYTSIEFYSTYFFRPIPPKSA